MGRLVNNIIRFQWLGLNDKSSAELMIILLMGYTKAWETAGFYTDVFCVIHSVFFFHKRYLLHKKDNYLWKCQEFFCT